LIPEVIGAFQKVTTYKDHQRYTTGLTAVGAMFA
jgi:hypothetical protein